MIRSYGRSKTEFEGTKQDYAKYRLTVKQWCLSGLVGIVGAVCMVMIFYRNQWITLLSGVCGAVIVPYMYKQQLIQRRRQQLSLEFKEALYSLVVSLRAGRSLEGAFTASLEDLDPIMMPLIYREWGAIINQIQVGFTIEDSLEDLGNRSGIEEIQSFARTITICKRTEGDVARVMENTIHLLQERMEIQNELRVLLIKKKTEQKILNLMPFVVIGLLLLMSPDYLSPLYDCLQGQIIMTVCVFLTFLSYILSKKISDIVL